MTGAQTLVSAVAVQAIFWSGLIGPVVMALFWRWWRTRLGWSIAAKTIALSLALLLNVLVYYFGPAVLDRFPWLLWFVIVMLCLVPLILWWRVYEIYRVQRRGGPNI